MEIRNYCINNANEEYAIKSQRYFKEKFNGYGLKTIQISEKAKELLSAKNICLEVAIKAMHEFLAYGKYEEISCGLMIINGLDKEFSRKTFDEIGKFYELGITNWAHADVLGMFILPKFLFQKIITINDFKDWKHSQFKFQRRSVPVTLIKKIKKDKDSAECINFITSLVNDNEREVHQGVGWFLREAWKIDKKGTEKYLTKIKDSAPRLIMQYACEKMNAEEKQKFKRNK
jgi:3-methyladenine DNA glycosylase AlkD